MKRIILFEEGAINLIKPNMKFLKVNEDEWAYDATDEQLREFCEVNAIWIDRFNRLAPMVGNCDHSEWGYVVDYTIKNISYC